MFDAVIRFLGNVAGARGTLLVLDDLQWAGRDAVDLLAAIVRSATAPIRVIGAYSDTEVAANDPLAVMLADLAIAGLAMHRTLAPLTEEESADLLDMLPDRETRRPHTRQNQAVLHRSGGVPFFLMSCAQWLQAEEGTAAPTCRGMSPIACDSGWRPCRRRCRRSSGRRRSSAGTVRPRVLAAVDRASRKRRFDCTRNRRAGTPPRRSRTSLSVRP